MRPLPSVRDAWQNIPPGLRSAVENHLDPGETPVAWFEPDLDARLNYSSGLVVLTDRRVLSVDWDEQLSTSFCYAARQLAVRVVRRSRRGRRG